MSLTLKAARVNKQLTQAQASEALGIDIDTLRSWEYGKTFPTVPQITKIEQLYEVKYSDLNFLPEMSV